MSFPPAIDHVSVITGATSGLGEFAAASLAQKGGALVLVGRNSERGAATLRRITEKTGNRRLSFLAADLSSMGEIQRLADTIMAEHPRIDCLINNAGAIFSKRQESPDGFEMTFALNHLAYFLLSTLLLDPLRRAGGARVISVASAAHRRAVLDFDDLQLTSGYSGWRAYQRSKLANILFTREFASRHGGEGIVAVCLHPGFIATRIGDNNGGLFTLALGAAKRIFAETVETGGGRLAYLATTPDLVPGAYYVRNRPVDPEPAARSDTDAARLWQASLDLTTPWHRKT